MGWSHFGSNALRWYIYLDHGEIFMRCRACDVELTDIESTRKDPQTGEFLDLCGGCLTVIRQSELEDDLKINDVVSIVTDQEM